MYNKDIQWVRLTGDRKLADRPCWLHYAFLECISGSGAVHLHDGPDDSAPVICDLTTTSNEYRVLNPKNPIFCQQGLFVDFDGGNSLLIQWEMDFTRSQGAPTPPAPAAQE